MSGIGKFDELNLFEDAEDGEEFDLYVTTRDGSVAKFERVNSNPVMWKGIWTIPHHFRGKRATSMFPADEVWFFTVTGSE